MKDWVIIYVDNGVQATTVVAQDVMEAILVTGIDVENIVSVQCVNTDAPVTDNNPFSVF